MNKMLTSLLMIGVIAGMAGAGTWAYFSDTETSSGNTFTAGTLDLQVNGEDTPVAAVVTIEDLKPSIPQYADITLEISGNSGYLWKYIGTVEEDTNGVNEPECNEIFGTWDGNSCTDGTDINDLSAVTDFDLMVDTSEIIGISDGISIDDVTSCWIPLGGPFEPDTEVTVNQSFHLRAAVTNWAQTDRATFEEVFGATQTNTPPSELTKVWDSPTKKCV